MTPFCFQGILLKFITRKKMSSLEHHEKVLSDVVLYPEKYTKASCSLPDSNYLSLPSSISLYSIFATLLLSAVLQDVNKHVECLKYLSHLLSQISFCFSEEAVFCLSINLSTILSCWFHICVRLCRQIATFSFPFVSSQFSSCHLPCLVMSFHP